MARPVGTKKHGEIRYLKDEELKRFLKEASKNIRNNFLFRLIIYLGLRVGEAAKIRLSNFNEQSFELTITALKGGSRKTYELPDRIWKRYKAWLRERKKIVNSDKNPYLFPHKIYSRDEPMSRDGIQNAFRSICKKTAIKNHSIHDLRHTTAIKMVNQGANAVQVSRWLRHKSIISSQVYFALKEDKEFNKQAPLFFNDIL